MGSLTRRLTGGMRRLVASIVGLIPGPPSNAAPPPDIDGRRPSEADLTQITVDAQRKAGKGSVR